MMKHNVRQWEVAHALGLHENSFSRKLRYELADEERERVLSAVKQLSRNGGGK